MKTANCSRLARTGLDRIGHPTSDIRHQTSGFTLIELLVVISVIMILVGILYPVYSRAKESARIAGCRTNLHQLGMLLAQYHLDHNAYPPPPTEDVNGNGILDPNEDTNGNGVIDLLPQTGGLAVLDPDGKYVCPSDPRKTTAGFRFSYNMDDRGVGSQILYNYWGYDANGYDVNTRATYFTPAESGAAVPAELQAQGIDSWLKFPMLANRQAPKYTIVTHCTFHYGARNGLAIILRLDGSVKAVPQARDTWNQDLGGGVTKWISQPIEGS